MPLVASNKDEIGAVSLALLLKRDINIQTPKLQSELSFHVTPFCFIIIDFAG